MIFFAWLMFVPLAIICLIGLFAILSEVIRNGVDSVSTDSMAGLMAFYVLAAFFLSIIVSW